MDDRHPNLVVIICDDLTWGDLSAHGNPHVRTPNLDRLRAGSARLEQYRSGPLCTPARAALMTGRYAYRTRAIDTYCGRTTLDPGETTLAEILREAGYRTSLSGKWHLGDNLPSRPQDKGFDEVLMHLGGGLCQPANFGHADYFDPDLEHNGRLVPHSGYCSDIFTDHALKCMRKDGYEPFFAYLAFNAPHTPLKAPSVWLERFAATHLNPAEAACYAMVENLDHNVGRILEELEATGKSEQTIVVFTSDHGGQRFDGTMRYNAGLRGYKGTPYDGGLRVPCFISWPGTIDPRPIQTSAHPIDLLPTLTSLCQVSIKSSLKIDGCDLELSQPQPTAPLRCLVHQWHRGDTPVKYRNYMITDGRYKLCRPADEAAPDELYDLLADPAESRNLASHEPTAVSRLRTEYEKWFDDVSSTRADNYAPVPAILGDVRQNPVRLNRNDWRVHARDGWDDDIAAHWEVEWTRPGRYFLTLLLPPREHAGVAHLHVQAQCRTQALMPMQTTAHFEILIIHPGRDQLRAWASSTTDRDQFPRFIEVLRLTDSALLAEPIFL